MARRVVFVLLALVQFASVTPGGAGHSGFACWRIASTTSTSMLCTMPLYRDPLQAIGLERVFVFIGCSAFRRSGVGFVLVLVIVLVLGCSTKLGCSS